MSLFSHQHISTMMNVDTRLDMSIRLAGVMAIIYHNACQNGYHLIMLKCVSFGMDKLKFSD